MAFATCEAELGCGLFVISGISLYGTTVGALNAESPKSNLVAKQAFRARICTIICMREATYIYDAFRMRQPPRPLKRPQN